MKATTETETAAKTVTIETTTGIIHPLVVLVPLNEKPAWQYRATILVGKWVGLTYILGMFHHPPWAIGTVATNKAGSFLI